MGLFSKKKVPVIFKDSSLSKDEVSRLYQLLSTAPDNDKQIIESDIKNLEKSIELEQQILTQLKNSNMPMYILHDLYLEDEKLSAQIDFFIITPKVHFVVKCKNFDNRQTEDQNIYSLITQNNQNLELVRLLRGNTKTNFISKEMFDENFYRLYHSIVVVPDSQTMLDTNYPSQQVVSVSQLVQHIKKIFDNCPDKPAIDKVMANLAQFFLSAHIKNPINF